MKKKFIARVFCAVMVLVMLAVSCMGTAAMSISAPTTDDSSEQYYSVALEGGTLTVRLNPIKIKEMLEDGALTKQELANFIPADILETLSKGREITGDELAELASHYISADELKSFAQLLPKELVAEYFSPDMLKGIIELDEILALLPIDDILEGIDPAIFESLLTDEAMKYVLNEKVKGEVITPEFVNKLIDETTLVKDVFADPDIKGRLLALIDDSVVSAMLAHPVVGPQLRNLAHDNEVITNIINNSAALETLEAHIIADDDHLKLFLSDVDVEKTLIGFDEVHDYLISEEVIRQLANNHVITKDIVIEVFGDDLDTLVTADVIAAVMAEDSDFVKKILENEQLANKIVTDALIEDMFEAEYFNSIVSAELVVKDLDIDKVIEACAISDARIDAFVEGFVDTLDDDQKLYIYDTYGTEPTLKQLLKDSDVPLTVADICEEFTDITPMKLYNKGLLTVAMLRDYVDDEALADVIKNNPDARALLAASLKSNTTVKVGDYWGFIKDEDLPAFVNAVGVDKICTILSNSSDKQNKLLNLIAPDKVIETIGLENCKTILHNHVKDFINGVGMDKILFYFPLETIDGEPGLVDALGGYAALVKKNLITPEIILNRIGADKLVEFFDVEELISAIGTAKLVKYVDLQDVVDAAGGYTSLLSFYSREELIQIYNAIGKDNLVKFVQDNNLLELFDVKAFASDVIDLIKEKKPELVNFVKTIGRQSLAFLLTEVESISINGEEIYEDIGKAFDLNKIVKSIFVALPDLDDFMALETDDIFADYSISAVIAGREYSVGVEFGFLGDPSSLQTFIKKIVDEFSLDVSDSNIVSIDFATSDAWSDIYARLLESERVPSRIKEELLLLPTRNINSLIEILEGVSDEELKIVVEELADKLGDIKDKAYAKIDARFQQQPAVATYSMRRGVLDGAADGLSGAVSGATDKLKDAADKAKDAVDRTIDAFTSTDNLKAARNKVVGALEKIPESQRNITLMDAYNGDGNFSASASGSTDIYDLVTRKISIPEELKLFVKSTEITYGFDASVTMTGMNKFEAKLSDGSTFVTMLPEGVSLGVLSNVRSLRNDNEFMNGDLQSVDKMGSEDMTVYSTSLYLVTFEAPRSNFSETVIYIYGAESVEEPALPEAPLGYKYNGWGTYELNREQHITVFVDESLIYKTLTFKVNGEVHATVSFSIEDVNAGGLPASKIPSVPSIQGYENGRWEDYTLVYEDMEVNALYDKTVYTATFKANGHTVPGGVVQFTVDDILAGGLPAAKIPALPFIQGYENGRWESYTLGYEDIEIDAIYDKTIYTATFKANGHTVPGGVVQFTVDDILAGGLPAAKIPALPFIQGYENGRWESYTLGYENIEIDALYDKTIYTATFKNGNDVVGTVEFTVDDILAGGLPVAKIPAVPAAQRGYENGRWESYTLGYDNIEIDALYDKTIYTATFKANGQTVPNGVVQFTVDDILAGTLPAAKIPAVPAAQAGYESGRWETYTLGYENIEIEALYDKTIYTATFKADGETVPNGVVQFTIDDVTLGYINEPDVPAKEGYTGAWESYELKLDNIVINAVYEKIPDVGGDDVTYTATFVVDGNVIKVITFGAEDIARGYLEGVPAVPEKVGYTGAWEKYVLEEKNITVNAVYTANVYTATFMADGVVVGTVQFTVEDKTISEPAVPEKEGYTGAWESYKLGANDITINAIYTPVEEGGASFWWWILIVIAVLIIAAVIIFFVFFKKKDDGDDTPPTPDPEPVIAPVVEEEPEQEENVEAAVIEEIDEVASDDVDTLMSDDVAKRTIVFKEGGSTEGYRAIVNIGDINAAFAEGDTVSIETLKAKKLIPAKTQRVKILANGVLNKHHLTVEADSFSLQAVKMITLMGGTAVEKK